MNQYTKKNFEQFFNSLTEKIINFKKSYILLVTIIAIIFFNLTGCASKPISDIRINSKGLKNIFIFIDGTGNTAESQTNVRRMYEMISSHTNDNYENQVDIQERNLKNENTVALYIEGVGDPRHPITGFVFGKGASHRIEESYAELIKIYRKGDRVYIFGFSRGANFARALAGLISYAGIPQMDSKARTPKDYYNLAIEIHDKAKALEDKDHLEYWDAWFDGKPPPMDKEIKAAFGYPTIPVTIELLGIWDTVPGSFKKKYGPCMEEVNHTKGTRYKTNSYPTIKRIAHAMAIDEKRDRFQLLHVCNPINLQFTVVKERWFPGAHSDVGGGFSGYGAFDLPNLSLSWMFDQLALANYKIPDSAEKIKPDPMGVAHWTDTSLINTIIYDCVDRDFNSTLPGVPEREIDSSYYERSSKKAKLQVGESLNDNSKEYTYPIDCAQFKEWNKN